ncbi:YtxH domain-containing protein [bacterium]|nr:YtxH domain-containing protein [bacterium]
MSKNKSLMLGLGLIAGVVSGIVAGVLFAPQSGEESRKKLKDAACELYEKHSPAIKDAKKQALESIDLMKYKLERQLRKFNNMIKSKKLLKAKELEETDDEYNNY